MAEEMMPADELVFLGNFVVLGVAAVGAVAANNGSASATAGGGGDQSTAVANNGSATAGQQRPALR